MRSERRTEGRGPRAEVESRNAYGYPVGVASEDAGAYRVRRGTAPSAAEDAEWYADLPEGERAGLRRLQERVVQAVRGLIEPEEACWLAEETLWQIRAELKAGGRVVLPEIGTLELVDLEDGSACLLAVASRSLDGEVPR